jgi:hypothetical protein
MMLQNLCVHQKVRRKEICSDISCRIFGTPVILEKIVTCVETHVFQYDADTNH